MFLAQRPRLVDVIISYNMYYSFELISYVFCSGALLITVEKIFGTTNDCDFGLIVFRLFG